MSVSADEFFNQYRGMLKDYLTRGGEGPLHHAYELGRQALTDGTGLLDLTFMHQQALEAVLKEIGKPGRGETMDAVRKASHFLEEVLSPYEVSRLSGKDANAALRRLYDVGEEEAKRIAHILHDEAAQMLATIYLELADIARDSSKEVAGRVHQVVAHLDEVREQLRGLSHELRPLILDQLGLIPALRYLASGVQKRSGLEISVDGDTDGRLPQSVETVLYRTVQESLNNVTRHARAKRAEVRVWLEENMVYCIVQDDGVGFEVPDERRSGYKGLGLVGIQERVGALQGDCKIDSQPGKGTELKVVIPL